MTGEGNKENRINFNTIFEFAEIAWVPKNEGPGHATNLGGNVTEVDLFSFPLRIAFEGNDPSQPTPTPVIRYAGFDQTRADMLNAYSALGAPWTSLLLTNTEGAPLRVVAPYHGIELGVFDKKALAPYIDKVWSSGTPIKVTAACPQDNGKIHSFVGQSSNDALVFSEDGVPKFTIPKPTTFTVYTNELRASPTPPDELTQCLSRAVAAKLGGALVRTVVLSNPNLDDCMVDQFYKSDPVQKFARFFHQFGINNLAYAFGYDDTCDQSSFITVDDPTAVDVWISGTQ